MRTLNYGNYGIFLTMGNTGFISPTVFGAMILVSLESIDLPKSPGPPSRPCVPTTRTACEALNRLVNVSLSELETLDSLNPLSELETLDSLNPKP